ncbi:unnamed protein product [Aphanomyces euteiches]
MSSEMHLFPVMIHPMWWRTKRLIYVVAGEASGDAIGAKLIQALEKHSQGPFAYRGVGGPQMMKTGRFESLFPMEELSVMGLIEVIPKLFVFKRRIKDVVRDVEASRPHAIVTIDSKGFCFRVLDKLKGSETRRHAAVVHYVAPSNWAYKHKHSKTAQTSASLQHLMDRMLVLLPFEERLFNKGSSFSAFVGHPAVEDFLEKHSLFRPHALKPANPKDPGFKSFPRNEWLDERLPLDVLSAQTHIFEEAMPNRQPRGDDRENEVNSTVHLVKDAITSFVNNHDKSQGNIHVVFPTVRSIAPILKDVLDGWSIPWTVEYDNDAKQKMIESSNVAVAVSGTVVIESVLAGLPTIVIYRANRVTEMIAKLLARVRFVSLPNIMMERELIPELIFSQCTSANLTTALQKMYKTASDNDGDNALLCAALSQLAVWNRFDMHIIPRRASELAADVVVEAMAIKETENQTASKSTRDNDDDDDDDDDDIIKRRPPARSYRRNDVHHEEDDDEGEEDK